MRRDQIQHERMQLGLHSQVDQQLPSGVGAQHEHRDQLVPESGTSLHPGVLLLTHLEFTPHSERGGSRRFRVQLFRVIGRCVLVRLQQRPRPVVVGLAEVVEHTGDSSDVQVRVIDPGRAEHLGEGLGLFPGVREVLVQGDPAVSSGPGVLGTGDALRSGRIPEVVRIDVVLDRVLLGGVETVFDAVAAEPGLHQDQLLGSQLVRSRGDPAVILDREGPGPLVPSFPDVLPVQQFLRPAHRNTAAKRLAGDLSRQLSLCNGAIRYPG